ncbi:MAG: hypothetical protein FWC08_13360 [Defluviitaleaceae bacterium]|nr:hypothetical protein [Defluviitaleaceae bacterium]
MQKTNETKCATLFKAGDAFEVTGSHQYTVIYATDEYFICCRVVYLHHGSNEKAFMVSEPHTCSNKGVLADKYWIKKINPFKSIRPALEFVAHL